MVLVRVLNYETYVDRNYDSSSSVLLPENLDQEATDVVESTLATVVGKIFRILATMHDKDGNEIVKQLNSLSRAAKTVCTTISHSKPTVFGETLCRQWLDVIEQIRKLFVCVMPTGDTADVVYRPYAVFRTESVDGSETTDSVITARRFVMYARLGCLSHFISISEEFQLMYLDFVRNMFPDFTFWSRVAWMALPFNPIEYHHDLTVDPNIGTITYAEDLPLMKDVSRVGVNTYLQESKYYANVSQRLKDGIKDLRTQQYNLEVYMITNMPFSFPALSLNETTTIAELIYEMLLIARGIWVVTRISDDIYAERLDIMAPLDLGLQKYQETTPTWCQEIKGLYHRRTQVYEPIIDVQWQTSSSCKTVPEDSTSLQYERQLKVVKGKYVNVEDSLIVQMDSTLINYESIVNALIRLVTKTWQLPKTAPYTIAMLPVVCALATAHFRNDPAYSEYDATGNSMVRPLADTFKLENAALLKNVVNVNPAKVLQYSPQSLLNTIESLSIVPLEYDLQNGGNTDQELFKTVVVSPPMHTGGPPIHHQSQFTSQQPKDSCIWQIILYVVVSVTCVSAALLLLIRFRDKSGTRSNQERVNHSFQMMPMLST